MAGHRGRTGDVADLYKNYIIVLAAIPAVFGFLKMSLIGVSIPFAGTIRIGIGAGLSNMLLTYVLSLVGVFVLALIIDALAPTFGGQKDQTQALKTVAYAYTASWVAGFGADPAVARYADPAGRRYLRHLPAVSRPAAHYEVSAGQGGGLHRRHHHHRDRSGLPRRHRCRHGDRRRVDDGRRFIQRCGQRATSNSTRTARSANSNSGARASSRPASRWKRQRSPAINRRRPTRMKALMGAALGGGTSRVAGAGSAQVVPARVARRTPARRIFGGTQRRDAGFQISEARATYANEAGKTLTLEITDSGSAKGLLGLAGWAGVEGEKQTGDGYEKTYRRTDA